MTDEPTSPDETLDEVWRRHGKAMSESDFRAVIEQQRDERASWAEREHAKARKKADKAKRGKNK